VNFHQIIVLKDGTTGEQGTHNELLASGGVYKEIYDMQFRQQEEAAHDLNMSEPRQFVAERGVR